MSIKEKLKAGYEFYKELPELVLFLIKLPMLLLQRDGVKLGAIKMGTINILGNGPSAHLTYLANRKKGEELMCLNFFALTKEFVKYKPERYTLIDPYILLNESDRSRLSIDKNKFLVDLIDKNKLLMDAFNSVDWCMKLYVPYKFKKTISNTILNKNVELRYIRCSYLPGKSRLVYNLYSKNLATPKFQNVMVACIYVALNNRFTEIKLHGVEANEFKNLSVNAENEVLLESQHSYGNSIINLCQEGEVRKGEFWKYLSHYPQMLKGFSQVESYSRYVGHKVFNYTKDSCIDVFEKK